MKSERAPQIARVIALTLTSLYVGCCVNVGDNYRAKATRTEELYAPLTDVTTMETSTNVGTIQFAAADVAEAHIVATITVKAKTAEEAEGLLEEVRIVAEQSDQRLLLKAVKPSGLGRNKLLVSYAVTARPDMALQCTTNVGDVKTTGFAGPVQAKTDVGSIVCTGLRHAADLRTNVGNIEADYAPDAPPALNVSATTNVGDIDLTGPQDISARLSANVNVGSIDTRRPLMIQGKIQKSIQATLGQAEGQAKLSTNVGSIRIH